MKRRIILAAAALLGVLAWTSPVLKAGRYKAHVQQAIENAIHRQVDIGGELRFSVFTGLGISLENVVIHEDPAIGIEPLAYVASLDAKLKLSSLLRGRWEVSRIVLDEPTVNLMKIESGSWNVAPLLGLSASSGSISALPEIQVRAGRLNFKTGDSKSVVYCTNADVEIARRSPQEVGVRFSVEPARTDRPARGFGTVSGSGSMRWTGDKPGELDLNIDIERTALSGLALLLEGHGVSMSGFLASRAHVRGPLSALKIDGRLRLEDVQRWNLLNFGGGDWPVRYEGTMQFPAGELDLETRSESSPAPFRLRLRARHLLDNPTWGAILHFREQPVPALVGLLQYLGAETPPGVSVEGNLSGVLGYSRAQGLQGLVEVPDAKVKLGEAEARLGEATVVVERDMLRLRPVRAELDGGLSAEVQGFYSSAGRSFTWNSSGQPLPVTRLAQAQREMTGAVTPLLDALAAGEWNGSLRYQQSGDGAATWDGAYNLRNARIAVNGLAEPVQIQSASVTVRDNRVVVENLAGQAGSLVFRGSYREDRPGGRARLKLQADEVDLERLEKLMRPTLTRRPGFLARTLQLAAAPLPAWLRERRLDAQIEIAALTAGAAPLGSLSGRMDWSAAQIHFTEVHLTKGSTKATGDLTVRLTQTEPLYQWKGAVRDLPWKGGVVDAEGTIDTFGSGIALLRNAKSSGRFSGEGLELTSGEFRAVTGEFEFSVSRSVPTLRLNRLEATLGPEVFTGQGRTENDGRLQVDLASSARKLRMAGALWPFELEEATR